MGRETHGLCATLCIATWLLILRLHVVEAQELEPPQVLRGPKSQVVVRGSTVTLTCELRPENARVFWNWTDMETGKSRRVSNDYQLTLRSFSRKDVGMYMCGAETTLGAAISTPALVELAKISRFNKTAEVMEVRVQEGNTAVIRCRLNSKPAAVMSFTREGKPVETADKHGRFHVLSWGDLYIERSQMSDSGVYRCHARNPVLDKSRHAAKVHLVVSARRNTSTAPQFRTSPDLQMEYTLTEGKTVTLECSAKGNPAPNVTWTDHISSSGLHRPLVFGGRFSRLAGNLVIVSALPTDSGLYVCRAENGVGNAAERKVKVTVYELPHVHLETVGNTIKGGVVRVSQGQRISLRCVTDVGERNWKRNLQELWGEDNIKQQGDRLVISDIGVEQSGVYQCMATTQFGMSQGGVYVQVKAKALNSRRKRPNKKKGNKRPKHKRRDGKERLLPEPPLLLQTGPGDVELKWNVFRDSRLGSIKYFRLQYQERTEQGWRPWVSDPRKLPPAAGVLQRASLSGLNAESRVRFRVAAVYGADRDDYSPVAELQLEMDIKRLALLQTPVIYTCVRQGDGSKVRLMWKPELSNGQTPFRGASGFNIEYWPFEHKEDKRVLNAPVFRLSYLIKNLDADVEYAFRVRAYNDQQQSLFSNIAMPSRISKDPEEDSEEAQEPVVVYQPETPEPDSDSPPLLPSQHRPGSKLRTDRLYIVLGALLGVLVLLLIIFVLVCGLRQRCRNANASAKLRSNSFAYHAAPNRSPTGLERTVSQRAVVEDELNSGIPFTLSPLLPSDELDSDEAKPEISSSGSSQLSSCSAASSSLSRRAPLPTSELSQPNYSDTCLSTFEPCSYSAQPLTSFSLTSQPGRLQQSLLQQNSTSQQDHVNSHNHYSRPRSQAVKAEPHRATPLPCGAPDEEEAQRSSLQANRRRHTRHQRSLRHI